MIRTKRVGASALLALFWIAAPAMAASASDVLRVIEKSDRNNDGKVTRAEHMALRKTIFDRLDGNQDGRVDKRDAPSPLVPGSARFHQFRAFLDSNGDGIVTRSEAINGRSAAFDRADRNRDGIVDKREMAALRAAAQRGV
ncbi:hypothetical protein [Sphingopyxis sp. JAI128]|uniref:hypothetical protein n=1 Tax=Sphingopyxis sp. JAI128 TaxID=2723066 RepID=UPI00161451EF|nr:hypothetical protein [Sphingopyxis sp. JAI128]MBB6427026.1 hypothetical protein [Sphingopyxis sp. JAI128]